MENGKLKIKNGFLRVHSVSAVNSVVKKKEDPQAGLIKRTIVLNESKNLSD